VEGDVDARLEALEAARAESERAREEADARAEEALDERDALVAQLDAARKAVQGMQAAVDARLEVIDAKRNRNVQALKDAEARAEALTRERDQLAEELKAAPQAAEIEAQYQHRLEVAAERIRTLELQLFERDRGAQELDVELTSLLDAPTPPTQKAIRRAKRHRFSKNRKVHIDDAVGEVVDLSIGGAQVLCPDKPDVNRVVAVSFVSDGNPVSCQGRIVWAWLEPHSKGKPLRYRAGILFTEVDETAIEAFIARHAAT
jgi:hypothetical protein